MKTSRAPGTTAAQIALVASFVIASYFLVFDAGDYLRSFTATVYGRFWPIRHWMFVHIAAGTLALGIGAFQLCLACSFDARLCCTDGLDARTSRPS